MHYDLKLNPLSYCQLVWKVESEVIYGKISNKLKKNFVITFVYSTKAPKTRQPIDEQQPKRSLRTIS